MHPVLAGGLPGGVLGVVQTPVTDQELTVEAALTGLGPLVLQAMLNDLLVDKISCAGEMLNEMLMANALHLPQFR